MVKRQSTILTHYQFMDDENAFLIIESNKTIKVDSFFTCTCKGFNEDLTKFNYILLNIVVIQVIIAIKYIILI